MALYNEAQIPGSTYPGVGVSTRSRVSPNAGAGVILPQLRPHLPPSGAPPIITEGLHRALQTLSPNLTSRHDTPAGDQHISKSAPPIGPSLAGDLFNISPFQNVTSAGDAFLHADQRPLIPAGLKARVAAAMPPGMRHRTASWDRAVARFRSNRPTSGSRIPRE